MEYLDLATPHVACDGPTALKLPRDQLEFYGQSFPVTEDGLSLFYHLGGSGKGCAELIHISGPTWAACIGDVEVTGNVVRLRAPLVGVADTEYGPWPYSLVGATIEFEAASQSYAGRPYTMGFSDVARTPLVTL